MIVEIKELKYDRYFEFTKSKLEFYGFCVQIYKYKTTNLNFAKINFSLKTCRIQKFVLPL